MAARAIVAVAGEEPPLLTELVLAECIYVLESFYELDRLDFAEAYLVAQAIGEVVSFVRSIDRSGEERRPIARPDKSAKQPVHLGLELGRVLAPVAVDLPLGPGGLAPVGGDVVADGVVGFAQPRVIPPVDGGGDLSAR